MSLEELFQLWTSIDHAGFTKEREALSISLKSVTVSGFKAKVTVNNSYSARMKIFADIGTRRAPRGAAAGEGAPRWLSTVSWKLVKGQIVQSIKKEGPGGAGLRRPIKRVLSTMH